MSTHISKSTAAALGLLLCAPVAEAQLGPLFGGEEAALPRSAPALDPRIPRGRPMVDALVRPPPAGRPACSFRRPLCVHPAPGVGGGSALAWLDAFERAHDSLVLGAGAPSPLSDFDKGGTPALDLYLEPGRSPLRTATDGALALARDAGAAFCVAGAEAPSIDREATLCVGEAIAHRLDTAECAPARRALAEHLWLTSGNPTSEDLEVIDDAQAHPERTLLEEEGPSGAALLLYEHLDARGRGAPTGVPLALHALAAAGATPPGQRFENEPDVLDVFRASHGPRVSDVGRAVVGFAVARAFIGSRSTGEHVPSLDFTTDSGRMRFDWRVSLSSLPRHLSTAEPVGPLGATYLWLDLDEPTERLTLALRAEWEGPVSFAWALVTVDASGRALGRFDAPYLERSRRAERTLADFDGARGVLIVGTQLGDVGAAYPYDPDFSPHERHAATVYLAKLAP